MMLRVLCALQYCSVPGLQVSVRRNTLARSLRLPRNANCLCCLQVVDCSVLVSAADCLQMWPAACCIGEVRLH